MEQLTTEEQHICQMASDHWSKQGKTLAITHVSTHAVSTDLPPMIYMVLGDIPQEAMCMACRTQHMRTECMLFVRVGDGFVYLEHVVVKHMHESPALTWMDIWKALGEV